LKIVEDAVERRLRREAWERVAEGSQQADGWVTDRERELEKERCLAGPHPERKYIEENTETHPPPIFVF
jgi:hypothetical protein